MPASSQSINVYTLLEDLEKIQKTTEGTGQKVSEALTKINPYANQPTREKLVDIKTTIEKFDGPNKHEKDFKKKALQWIEYQEITFLEKNHIHWLYLRLRSKNKKFLSSPNLDKEKKQFLQELQKDLETYVDST